MTNLMLPLLWIAIHFTKYILLRFRRELYSAESRAALNQLHLLSVSALGKICARKPEVTVATCWEEFEYLGFPLSDEWKPN